MSTPRHHNARCVRVWLAAADSGSEPLDRPVVRDQMLRHWLPTADGRWRSADGRHHATWAELHARFDLIETSPDNPRGSWHD